MEHGTLSVPEAEAALRKIGMSKEAVVEQTKTFLVGMEKGPGRTHRMLGASYLKQARQQIKARPGSLRWVNLSYRLINTALRNGDISYKEFLKQRAEVAATVKPGSTGDQAALNQWIDKALATHTISPGEAEELRRKWQ